MKIIKNLVTVTLINFVIFTLILAGSPVIARLLPEPQPPASVVLTETTLTPTPTVIKKVIKVVRRLVTPSLSVTSAPPPPTTPANEPAAPPPPPPDPLANRCLITIDGVRYDVTDFRFLHSGGNVFTCGADESAAFHNRHPNSFLQKMDRYRV